MYHISYKISSKIVFNFKVMEEPHDGDGCTSEMLALLDVEQIFNTPLRCPVSYCGEALTPIEMLAHLLMSHRPGESMQEAVADRPQLLHVQMNELEAGVSHVIGALAYHGTPQAGVSTPVTPELQVVHQLPVMLVMYITPPLDNVQQVVIFYMVSPLVTTELGVAVQISLLDGNQDKHGQKSQCLLSSCANLGAHGYGQQLFIDMDFIAYSASGIQRLIDMDPEGQLHVKVILTGEPNSW
ncbi:uncharacterized protein LOC117902424 [Drosophila subobscura]|uniref:uncharacterized protein LOC117902424 n=1 Tax=Drosophila subobscura TaxID=7241 RepID=UPI00155AABF4|nr:uncharacterized protein LOC117902424 [Drosophila subobscura]